MAGRGVLSDQAIEPIAAGEHDFVRGDLLGEHQPREWPVEV